MKLKVFVDSGANIHSCRKREVELWELGLEDDDWKGMSDQEKQDAVLEWAWDTGLEVGYEEL